MERLALTHLIGKTVTLDPNRFSHLENQGEALSLDLPQDATQMHVEILDERGEPVYDVDLGAQSKGRVSVPWNGLKPNHLPAKSGQYLLRATAQQGDRKIQLATQAQGEVSGISFEGAEPVLIVTVGGNTRQPHKVKLNAVVQVEDRPATPFGPARREHRSGPHSGVAGEARVSSIQNFFPAITRLPGAQDAPKTEQGRDPQAPEFREILGQALEKPASSEDLSQLPRGLKFSAHASQRLQERNLQMDAPTLAAVNAATDRAAAKGLEETLILTPTVALIVNPQNRMVITAMARDAARGNVFTQIDGAVII